MSTLAYAARNMLAEQSSVTSLLGSDSAWDSWIFVDAPQALVENSGTSLIVITQTGPWAAANDYNTARFPQLTVDIWSDPTRNGDLSVRRKDAKLKIDALVKQIDKFMHVLHPGPNGIIWHGLRVVASKRADGDVEYFPSFDNKGGYMGRIRYDISI